MLQTLSIRNLALLEELSLDFDAGFTVVTGETGAGKSVLLGGLSLLAGQRADKTIIRQGAAACEVEASLFFQDPTQINTLLLNLDLPACEEGVLLIKRTLPREKPQRISVNGSMATLNALLTLGEQWIDFHGPSEPRRLLKDSCQLELLDLFARNDVHLQPYQAQYSAWRHLIAERERIAGESRLEPDQIAFLQAQLARLDALDLSEESIGALERDFARSSRAQELIEIATTLASALSSEEGIAPQLSTLLREARQLEGLDPSSKPLADRLNSALIDLADLGDEFNALASECQFDPEQAAELQEKMNAWLEAKRRHGGDLVAVSAAREELRQRLEIQGDVEGSLARLENDIAKAHTLLRQKANTLREHREKAARELAKVAAKAIAQLGFKKADFQINLHTLENFAPSGDCRCEFVFSPNVGEAPLPLSRIASSGELARVMLALKTVLADLDNVPVLVFDEVDANVGGEIGRVVGEKMAKIAANHQVFCVTHLPQVAALGLSHYLVEKDQSSDRAKVRISPLHTDRKARVSEIARMLGDRTAKSALAHAEELLAP